MNKMMITSLIFGILFISFFTPISIIQAAPDWWNSNWQYRQEIILPIDTSDSYSHFLPVDIQIVFENPCWTQDAVNHSIRVIMHDQGVMEELEIQIYALTFSTDTTLSKCNLIFLIPNTVTGTETFYVYYSDDETPSPEYVDHLSIEESYYFYEPITGFPFESSYYKILENENIAYAIAYQGEFMGAGTTHQVTKMKANTTEVVPQNGELFASFDFMYYYGDTMDAYSSTIDQLISKNIRVDGNLMVELEVTSTSKKEDVTTTAIYTYYYCPTDHKRIYAHIRHNAEKALLVAPDSNVDGTYLSLQVGGIRSTAIQELNFGRINPYLHVYTDENLIQEYPLDPDPTYVPDDWDIRVINTDDDIDLGNQAWASFDDGTSGDAHAIIMGSTDVITQGDNEAPGIQIKAHEQDYPHLPGLETDMAFLQYGRNSFEPTQGHDLNIPADFTVEFDAEFYTTHTGGYPQVAKEAQYYQQLLSIRPPRGENITINTETPDTYSLTTTLHLSPLTIPFGSILSAAIGRNYPYLSAELYRNTNRISSGIYSRIKFNPLPSLENTSLLDKIQLILGIIDWKNLSFAKQITFQNLPPDTYILKVYQENKRLGATRRYIGVQIINLTKNTQTRLIPQKQSTIELTIHDQHNHPIPDLTATLLLQNQPISQQQTNTNGKVTLTAPIQRRTPYQLALSYQGFTIHTEPLTLKRQGLILKHNKQYTIDRHTLNLHIQDTWKLPPYADINPQLIGIQNQQEISLPFQTLQPGHYQLTNLTPNDYHIRLQYSSYQQEHPITIPTDTQTITFNAEFPTTLNTLDAYSNIIETTTLKITRQQIEKTYPDFTSGSNISLPPGIYDIIIHPNDDTTTTHQLTIMGERSYDLFTTQTPWYLPITIISSLLLIATGLYLFYRNRNKYHLITITAIALIIIALFQPWWTLTGTQNQIQTTTHFIFLPTELITITQTPTYLLGELSSLPELIDLIILFILIASLIGCLALATTLFTKNTKKSLFTITLILGFLMIGGAAAVGLVTQSELSAATIGSVLGSGPLEIDIPASTTSQTISCSWGPGLGFYLYSTAAILILVITILHIKNLPIFHAKTPAERKKRRKKIWNYFKKLIPLTGIILLIFILYSTGIEKIIDTFLKITPFYIIISAALTFPRLFLRNTQWQYLLKKQKIFVSYWKSMKIFLISYFYGAITPGYLGLMIRIPYMKEATNQPFGKLFINSMAETAVHGLSLYIMMLFGALAVADQYPEIFYGSLIFVGASIVIYAFFISKNRGEKTFYFFIKLMIPKRFKSHLTRFVDTFYTDFPTIKDFIIPFLLGIPAWIIIYSQIYILAIPLDIEVPYFTFLALYAIGNIVALIPISTAGLGTREASLIFLFGLFGTPAEKAIVISLAGHLLTDVLTGIYGFIISLTEARNIEHKKEVETFLKN